MPAILWIHGFPLSPAIWDDQKEIAGFEHVAPALPGMGGAPLPHDDLSIDDYARHVLGELDARGIERAVFAGVSMGGYIAFAALRIAPERIERLILIDTRETPDTTEARNGRFAMMGKVRTEGIAPVVESMLPKMLTPEAPEPMRQRVRTIMESASPAGVVTALRALANRPDASSQLRGIRVPTLVVAGEHDTITPPADAERMAAAIPGARLAILPKAAHLANVEQPEAFNDAVSRFLVS
jgi:3-oxoadipate enol-lactonase